MLREPGTTVVPHAWLGDYSGVWFFVREGACIVSAPGAWCEPIRDALAERTFDAILSGEGLRALSGSSFDRTVGPAYQGWLEPDRFSPFVAPEVREVVASDAPAVERLQASCSEEDWRDADLKLDPPGAFGFFEAGELCAASSLTEWMPGIVGPGVLSRPDVRGRGCGAAVVSAAVGHALAADALVIYQTLMENAGACGIARRLGFEQYASHIAVRLTPRG